MVYPSAFSTAFQLRSTYPMPAVAYSSGVAASPATGGASNITVRRKMIAEAAIARVDMV